MVADVKDVIQEASSFFRFDLRRKGFVIEARPRETGWEVEAELLDPRPDLSTSYKKVYDQNIYLIRVASDLKIVSCEKIGRRETNGEIRFFPKVPRAARPLSPKPPSRAKESKPEKQLSLDPSIVGNLADEISRRVSSSLDGKYGSSSSPETEEERITAKEAFIDPHQEANLDFNFTQVGKLEREEEGDLSDAVEQLSSLQARPNPKVAQLQLRDVGGRGAPSAEGESAPGGKGRPGGKTCPY
ncbi:MAG: hypothetical protein A3G38_03020 [Omnitrophica WOR_2 bacterium RIFCSPLOWO2_12_FULL_51_8]|nr:MAG: hypothetical protein A3G38_03020 [Omnitrophica WOR_2 bacterium RIFCSPLOWO2_12_FULL_51_8]